MLLIQQGKLYNIHIYRIYFTLYIIYSILGTESETRDSESRSRSVSACAYADAGGPETEREDAFSLTTGEAAYSQTDEPPK